MSAIRERAIYYLIIFFCSFILSINVLFIISQWGYPVFYKHSLLSQPGYAVGGDFSVYYAASKMVLSGRSLDVFNNLSLNKTILTIVGWDFIHYQWHYPPTYLLLISPLSLVPYFSALLLWLGVALSIYLWIGNRIAPHKLTVLLCLTFPGTLLNFLTGQNGFLSAILLGGGLLLLERRPWVGGLLLGLASYKPHLAILVPVALVAGRRWRALLSAFLAAAGLILLSLVILGPEVWWAFLKNIPYSTQFLYETSEPGVTRLKKMSSLFAAVRLMGGSNGLAWMLQGLVMLAATASVAWVWQRETAPPYRNAALLLGCLLFPPFLYYYDLAILALPLAWLAWEGLSKGWQTGEQHLLMLGWVAPFLIFPLGWVHLHLPVIPAIIGGLLIYALRASFQVPRSLVSGRLPSQPS